MSTPECSMATKVSSPGHCNTETTRAEAVAALALLLLAAVFSLFHSPALAATDALTAQPMRFVRYDRDDGLSQSSVNQIAQDSSGFMWFATESGLNRFDGYDFTTYRRIRGKADTLPNDFITDIAVDTSGDLWITTDGGGLIQRRARSMELAIHRNEPGNPGSLINDNLRTVLADPRGWVWVGTMRHGLTRLDPAHDEFVTFRYDAADASSLSNDSVYSLWLDVDGVIWIGTGAGLDRLDPDSGSIKHYRIGDADNGDRILAIHRDSAGDLWLGTAGHGLIRLDETDNTLQYYRHETADSRSLASDRVEVIFEDSAGRLWVGTNGGLHLMDADRSAFTRYRHDPSDPSSLSDNYVISIFEDRSGVLWIGTKTGGINKWNSRSWLLGHIRPASGDGDDDESPKITSFTHDHNEQLWVGTFGSGILVLGPDSERRTQLRKGAAAQGGLSDDVVMSLLTDADGHIWAGTMHGGLNRIDPVSGEVSIYRHEPGNSRSLAANGIMSLYAANDGTIWVGTFGGGVSRYDRETDSFSNYPHRPDVSTSLSNPNASAITEDAEGSVWVATSGGGLNRLNTATGKWERFQHDPNDPDSLSGNAVYSLHVSRAGTLWAGTRTGLNRFVPNNDVPGSGSFRKVTQSDGLPDEAIYGILSDTEGRLWLSTNYGIARYDPQTGNVRSYHLSDGLQGEEFNFGAYYADGKGMLYFGGHNGFNAFDPSGLEFSANPPVVVLTGIKKFNKPVATNVAYEFLNSLPLDYSEDMVNFEFSAVEYTAPSRNLYAYKLDGFDRDWVQAGTSRRATYTDLPGGRYVFRVRAANSDGVWGESDISLAVSVKHPPWLRPWAFALYMLVAIGVVYLLYRVQARKLAREAEYSRRLEAEVNQRTSELAQSNSELHDANDKLRTASLTDALTGLRNRRYLFEEILKDVELARRRHDPRHIETDEISDIVFVMVDLDHFKPINDNHGHLAGDRVLLKIRDVLQSVCRTSDTVIRWGGDEFLIVGRESTHNQASRLAERVRAEIERTVFPVGNGQVARTTCSIGFASYPFIQDSADLLSWEQVLGVADAAMYLAKEDRNAWVGVHGEFWHGTADALYQKLQSDLESLVDDGCLRIERSLKIGQAKTA